jgi:hypothetical protein
MTRNVPKKSRSATSEVFGIDVIRSSAAMPSANRMGRRANSATTPTEARRKSRLFPPSGGPLDERLPPDAEEPDRDVRERVAREEDGLEEDERDRPDGRDAPAKIAAP